MKITIGLLKACGVCGDALIWTTRALHLNNRESADFIEGRTELLPYLKNLDEDTSNGWLRWYDGLLTNPTAVKYYNDYTYLPEYRIIDATLNNQEVYFTNYDGALNYIKQAEVDCIKNCKNRFSVVRTVENDQCIVTTIPVDIESETEEGTFLVYNHETGVNEPHRNLQSAKDGIFELSKKFTDAHLNIMQKVTNPDGDIAWDTPQN